MSVVAIGVIVAMCLPPLIAAVTDLEWKIRRRKP